MSYPSRGLSDSPIPLVDRDDLEILGQRGHDPPPGVPGLGPTVNEQQRRALASDHRVQAHISAVDVPAGERVPEPVRKVRGLGDGAGACWAGRCAHEGLPSSRRTGAALMSWVRRGRWKSKAVSPKIPSPRI